MIPKIVTEQNDSKIFSSIKSHNLLRLKQRGSRKPPKLRFYSQDEMFRLKLLDQEKRLKILTGNHPFSDLRKVDSYQELSKPVELHSSIPTRLKNQDKKNNTEEGIDDSGWKIRKYTKRYNSTNYRSVDK